MVRIAKENTAITVECCGVLEELCGGPECRLTSLDLPVPISAVIDRLANEHPVARDMLQRSACAVGDRIVSRERLLQLQERLVLLPPVSGG